jgi:hypothetical protein
VGESRSRWSVLLRVVVVLVLAAVCGGVGLSLVQRNRAADASAEREASTFTPPPVSVVGPALVSVVSDETSGAVPGTAAARTAPTPWMSYVSSSLSVRIAPFVVPRSGYTKTGVSTADGGSTFVTRAGQISTTTRVALLIGGSADRSASRLSLIRGATSALAAARGSSASARLVVVGPTAPPGDVDQDLLDVRDTLKSAAGVADATFVDPIGSGWLDRPAYWSSSGTLTAAGQKELGARLITVLRGAFDS